MTTINLSGQRTKVDAALPVFQDFEAAMDQRRVIWDKANSEQRKKWIQSSNGTLNDAKDPVMWLAIQLWQYLSDWHINE